MCGTLCYTCVTASAAAFREARGTAVLVVGGGAGYHKRTRQLHRYGAAVAAAPVATHKTVCMFGKYEIGIRVMFSLTFLNTLYCGCADDREELCVKVDKIIQQVFGRIWRHICNSLTTVLPRDFLFTSVIIKAVFTGASLAYHLCCRFEVDTCHPRW